MAHNFIYLKLLRLRSGDIRVVCVYVCLCVTRRACKVDFVFFVCTFVGALICKCCTYQETDLLASVPFFGLSIQVFVLMEACFYLQFVGVGGIRYQEELKLCRHVSHAIPIYKVKCHNSETKIEMLHNSIGLFGYLWCQMDCFFLARPTVGSASIVDFGRRRFVELWHWLALASWRIAVCMHSIRK